MTFKKASLVSLLMVLILSASAFAGYLVSPKGDLPLVSQKIRVEIKNQVAVTTLEQIFYNPHDVTIQPNIRFPIHEKASVQGFSLTDSNGQTYEGTIEETNQATKEFNEAKEEGMMPAMAVQKKPGVFETSIGAIGPNSRATVVIEYSEILPYKSGKISYSLPFNVSSWQKKELDQVSVQISVADQKEIVSLISPSHDIYAQKVDANIWQANFERNNFLPNKDFSLDYEVKADEMAVNFLSTRPDSEKDGYFVLMLSPQEVIDQTDIADRDIVFIMDTSGSMSGNKLKQTKAAFDFFVNKLNENDRFGIVDFSDYAKSWNQELTQVSDKTRRFASEYIGRLHATGGTNIHEALMKALSFFGPDENRTRAIIFLTDGEASAGITSTPRIVEDFKKANSLKVRTFTLGVGHGVNRSLLGQIAMENRGEALYLDARANLDTELKGFYQSISTPLLVDLKLDFGDMQISECFPEELPNVYKGTQLVVTGRYKSGGNAAIKLSGMLNSSKKEFPIEASFVESSSDNRFVARYWARTKADELMKQIKAFGEKPELKEQVIKLSKEYQFATPYTSFIAVSTQQVPQIKAESNKSHTAAYANIRNSAKASKRVVVKKTKAKSLSLWGAAGFVPFAVAIPNFRKAREQSRVKACYANMRVLMGAVEMYNMDHTDQMTVLTDREIDLLVKEKYLKSHITRPETGCNYGTIGDLSGTGMVCCSLHGSVSEELPEKATAIYSDGADGYVSQISIKEQTPWTTRIWNDYLADFLNYALNIPLFILGLAFSLYVVWRIIIFPFKLVDALIRSGRHGKD
jgi:Ca-activated chloride channel family protein